MNNTENSTTIFSKEYENYAIGGMINDPKNLEIGCDKLTSDDFYFEENRVIFNTIKHLKKNNSDTDVHIDEIRVTNYLQQKNINGFDYKSHINIVSITSHSVDIEFYIKNLRDLKAKRKLIESCKEIFSDFQSGKNLLDTLERHKKNCAAIEQGIDREEKFHIKCIAELGENWLYETPPPKKMILEYTVNRKTHGFIPKGNVCMLVGMGGIGKSHWVSQLTASIATKTLFLDKFAPTEHCENGNVFLGMAENDIDDIRRILHKSTKYLRNNPEPNTTADQIKYDLEHKIFPYSFHGQQCQFIKDGMPSPYFYDLKRHLTKNAPPGGWTLIILDPISRFLGAEAEKDNAAATAFIALIEQLTMELPGNPTILFCHHMNKSAITGDASSQGASRGSTAITDGVRLQINLRKLSDDELKKLNEKEKKLELTMMTMSKSNFTRIIEDLTLKKEGDGTLSTYKNESRNTATQGLSFDD